MANELIANASHVEYPIDQLFQAIYVLQYLDECEDEVKSLTQKLEACWVNIPERNGKKVYRRHIRYYPNGLCESGNYKIILSPWTAKGSAKKPGESANYRGLKVISPIWYHMLKEQIGKKYKVTDYDFNFPEFFRKWQARKMLPPEQADLVNIGEDWYWQDKIERLIKGLYNMQVDGKQICFFPKEEELAECIAIGKMNYDDWGSERTMKEYVDQRVKPTVNLEDNDRVMLDFSPLYKDIKGFQYDEKFVDDVVEQLAIILSNVKDERVIKVLRKMQIIE